MLLARAFCTFTITPTIDYVIILTKGLISPYNRLQRQRCSGLLQDKIVTRLLGMTWNVVTLPPYILVELVSEKIEIASTSQVQTKMTCTVDKNKS